MAQIVGLDHKVIAISALGLSSAWAAFATYKYLKYRKVAKGNAYESEDLLHQYLIFHFGKPEEVLGWKFGPFDSLDFAVRCADVCKKHFQPQPDIPNRALDIGCGVGRSSFELTTTFDEVIGIDFSQSFVQACCQLKEHGEMLYKIQDEGELYRHLIAKVPDHADRSKVQFEVGDACNLRLNLGQFGCVLAANLICRLPTPKDFLARLGSLVAPGGIAVIMSPYTFLPEYTPKKNMIGGFKVDEERITGFDGLQKYLSPCFDLIDQSDMPFFIRETRRKNQWTVSHCTVWRRKRDV